MTEVFQIKNFGIKIRDNGKRMSVLIEITVSGDINVIKKEAGKILKHKDLTI